MENLLMKMLICLLVCLFVACSSKPSITQPPEWEYQKDAVRLRLKGDLRLNLYHNASHTLVVCVYQLRDPNVFNQVKMEHDGISKLLACTQFDSSVTQSKSFVIHPGQEVSEIFDRAAGTKYVGIVAGYYIQKEKQVTHLLQVPISEEKRGKVLVQKPRDFSITVHLGSQEIQEVYIK